jgi:hypothetical protein
MVVRTLQVAFALAGSSLLAMATLDYVARPSGPGVTIKEPDRTVNVGPAGHEAIVTFEFNNAGERPVAIMGVTVC